MNIAHLLGGGTNTYYKSLEHEAVGKRRPFTRPALSRVQRALQLRISRRGSKPAPPIGEKHLVDGKWTFIYEDEVTVSS
jgi:hypothetical protein